MGNSVVVFVTTLLQYVSAKNYQNTMPFLKIIAKIKGAIVWPIV